MSTWKIEVFQRVLVGSVDFRVNTIFGRKREEEGGISEILSEKNKI